MTLDFDDTCWSHSDADWLRSLLELLVLSVMHEQHFLLANPGAMLPWCTNYLHLYVDYFKTRLASAQPRAKSLKIQISPNGASAVAGMPPWHLTARAAGDLVRHPLQLVLENDMSDRRFLESTLPAFSVWQERRWITAAMGGGSEMEKKIKTTSNDVVGRWRTFYLFDSDRLHPSELNDGWQPPTGDGCQGYKFESACLNMPEGRWHRLNRRSIENYLPQSVLTAVNALATSVLFGQSVGKMAHYYNLKKGLAGDGVYPADQCKNVRASRSQGFWSSLPQSDIDALQNGFGSSISNEFNNVPAYHSWPDDVIDEMNALADALQDAI